MPRKQLNSPSLAQAIDQFVKEERTVIPPLAEGTILSKERTLRALVRHAPRRENTPVHRLQSYHFKDALLDLASGRKSTALKLDRTALRQFTEFCKHHKWMHSEFDPLYTISTAARPEGTDDPRDKKIMMRVPHDQWPALLDAAQHPRDRLLVAVGLWWARRVSDLVVMQWRHIDLTQSERYPHGSVELFNIKRGRRVGLEPLPIWPELRAELDRYLTWFHPLYGEPHPDWPLVPRKARGPEALRQLVGKGVWPLYQDEPTETKFCTRAVQKVLAAFCGPDADLTREGTHTLRRSGGRFVAETWGIEIAQRLLDHQTIQQTRTYVGWSKEDGLLSEIMRGAVSPDPGPIAVTPSEEPEAPMAVVVDLFSRRRVA